MKVDLEQDKQMLHEWVPMETGEIKSRQETRVIFHQDIPGGFRQRSCIKRKRKEKNEDNQTLKTTGQEYYCKYIDGLGCNPMVIYQIMFKSGLDKP